MQSLQNISQLQTWLEIVYSISKKILISLLKYKSGCKVLFLFGYC